MKNIKGKYSRRKVLKSVAALSAALAAKPLLQQDIKAYASSVPKEEPIRVLINDSPWFAGFAATVDQYTEATGNKVNLDVTPFPAMLEKARNSCVSGDSEYDVINVTEMNIQWFYNSGLVSKIKDIDPNFELSKEIISYSNAARWSKEKRAMTADGDVMGIPINGNIQLYYYRDDLFKRDGITPPKTWKEMTTIAKKYHKPPRFFGNANRANPIWWEFGAYMVSHDANYVQLEQNGKWSIGFEKPQAIDAINTWHELGREYSPKNYANLGQSELLGLMASGRLPQVHMVGAAAPNFDNPNKSAVIGQVKGSVVPGLTPESRSPISGMWVMAMPKNMSDKRKKAGLTFLNWMTGREQQIAYTLAGAIPVRQDAYVSLSNDPKVGWWTKAFAESTPFIRDLPRLPETPQIRQSLMKRMAQAYINEISVENAAELIAKETRAIMLKAGYDLI